MSQTLQHPSRIKAALIGYGVVGKTVHAGLELFIIVSSDNQKMHRDYPAVEVIADPKIAITHPEVDLVVIASPNPPHAPSPNSLCWLTSMLS